MKVKLTNTEPSVIITMKKSEAAILRTVCRQVGGDPDGARMVIDKLEGLLGAGVSADETCYQSGDIYLY